MKHCADPEAALQHVIRNNGAIIVAGTGVSMAASRDPLTGKPHPEASWAGLLESGLRWLQEHKLISAASVQAHLTLLREEGETHHFISAAQDVMRQMGGAESKHFADWLARTIGTILAHDRKGLAALEALRAHGNLLATTNYDGLLLDVGSRLTPVTWKEPNAFLRAARNKESDKVIFLHGYWRQPRSVILDWNSYQDIARDENYRQELAAVWQMTTWVYVGCGVNGLSDPDFGLLLERYGKHARHAEFWDFCLVRRSQREEFQAHFDRLQINICAVSIGDSHDDLPQYLRSLLPAPVSPPAFVVAVPTPSAQPNPIPEFPAFLDKSVYSVSHKFVMRESPLPASDSPPASVVLVAPPAAKANRNPAPSAFHADPAYIGSHQFVGRDSQLQDLSDWAKAADPTNLLLFEAIGGSGKSMLTWEWTTRHAPALRDWAGRFWYSFYERGAVMADFCRRALAYMAHRPLEELAKLTTPDLAKELLAQLHARPWLLVLDGLERVLVAYHRIDAAEVPDEEANDPTDKVLHRNPCDTIRAEDGDLLCALAAAAPSKILVSSRLMPSVLLNPAGQPRTGTRRITLPGLRPADAEQLLRSCGITGDSTRIQDYLTVNCDNHPLVIGVLAGLIANYLPARGNFDVWMADAGPQGGAQLNLASLDFVQRRNHILRAALHALPEKSRQLLSTLALLSASVSYETLAAFNPYMPPQLVEQGMPAVQAAGKLAETVRDLEQRGLLQYDAATRRYDLHPVVRGVAAGTMRMEDRERYGQRVVDHFSSLPHNPFEEARTLEDVAPGLHVVRTLLKLGRFQVAANTYRGDLARALLFSLEAYFEILSLLRPFFPSGWGSLSKEVEASSASDIANTAAIALRICGEPESALAAYNAALQSYLELGDWRGTTVLVYSLSGNFADENLLANALRMAGLAVDLATAIDEREQLFTARLWLFLAQSLLGQWEAAAETWQLLDSMGRAWPRATYRQGNAEEVFARAQFWQGTLQAQHLTEAARLAEMDNNRSSLRELHRLRGAWQLEQGDWTLAAVSFHEAVRMARERRFLDKSAEAGLALAKLHLCQFRQPEEARQEAKRLAEQRNPDHRYLAMLWRSIGDHAQAEKHALAAYKIAWADGEPYVHRYELTKITELLREMNVPIPDLSPYDPAKDEPFPWEADVRAAIAKLRVEKEARQEAEDRETD